MLHPDHIACDHRGCKATTRKVDVAAVLRASRLEGAQLRQNAVAILHSASDQVAEDGGWYFVDAHWIHDTHYCPAHGCTPAAKKRGAAQRTYSMTRGIPLRSAPCVEETQSDRFMRLAAARRRRDDPFAKRTKR